MVTGFDVLGHDSMLRRHWSLRVLAQLLDMIIVFFATGLVLVKLELNTPLVSGISSGIVLFLYSGMSESLFGRTAGKHILGFSVEPMQGEGGMGLFLRNIPKLFWYILLPIDTLLGLAGRGDPRQRIFDRMVSTTVWHKSDPPAFNPLETAEKGDGRGSCNSCGGDLMLVETDKYQCIECGVIQ